MQGFHDSQIDRKLCMILMMMKNLPRLFEEREGFLQALCAFNLNETDHFRRLVYLSCVELADRGNKTNPFVGIICAKILENLNKRFVQFLFVPL